MKFSIAIHTKEDTRRLASQVARLLRRGDIVLLVGEMGAGKTTFTQFLALALGVGVPVTSPTFALVCQYDCDAGAPPDVKTLLHGDLYRLDTLAEVADLGLGELVEDDAVAIVEWGDRGVEVLDRGALTITISVPREDISISVEDGASGSEPGSEGELAVLRERNSEDESGLGSDRGLGGEPGFTTERLFMLSATDDRWSEMFGSLSEAWGVECQ